MKKIWTILLLSVILILTGCAGKATKAIDKDTLTIGMELKYLPFLASLL